MSHENHFSWQAQYYLVKLECHFSWQVQHFLKFWEIIAGAPNVVFFHTKCVSELGQALRLQHALFSTCTI